MGADETQACPIKRVGQGKKGRVTLIFTPDAPNCWVLEAVENLFGDLGFPTDIPDRNGAFLLLENSDNILFVEFLRGQGLLTDTPTHWCVYIYWGRSVISTYEIIIKR